MTQAEAVQLGPPPQHPHEGPCLQQLRHPHRRRRTGPVGREQARQPLGVGQGQAEEVQGPMGGEALGVVVDAAKSDPRVVGQNRDEDGERGPLG